MANRSIGSSEKGFVLVAGQRRQKGTVLPIDVLGDGSIWMFQDARPHTNEIFIGSTPYGQITNADTGTAFASPAEITAFIEDHFFTEPAAGDGGAEPGAGSGIVPKTSPVIIIPADAPSYTIGEAIDGVMILRNGLPEMYWEFAGHTFTPANPFLQGEQVRFTYLKEV